MAQGGRAVEIFPEDGIGGNGYHELAGVLPPLTLFLKWVIEGEVVWRRAFVIRS